DVGHHRRILFIKGIHCDVVPRKDLKGERSDEPRRRFGHDHPDIRSQLRQTADQGSCLKGGNAPGHPDGDSFSSHPVPSMKKISNPDRLSDCQNASPERSHPGEERHFTAFRNGWGSSRASAAISSSATPTYLLEWGSISGFSPSSNCRARLAASTTKAYLLSTFSIN